MPFNDDSDAKPAMIKHDHHHHHIGTALRRELGDWRLWWARVLVISLAAAAGLTVVGFTWLTEQALARFTAMRELWPWAPLLWTPACTAAIVWATRRFAPGAAGSGIPQVMASLDSSVEVADRGLFVSLKLAVAKIWLTAWGLLAGLSLGREGPCVQIAAGIMLAGRRWLPSRSTVTDHGLLVAGGAAGIAAAFNTPLAGVMFAIEELSRTPEQRNSGLIVAAIVLAGLIAVSIHGNGTYFGVIHVTEVGLPLILPGLLVAVASGLAGGLFSRLLVLSVGGLSRDPISRLRGRRPIVFAAACGLVVAGIGLMTNGATFGSGYDHTRNMLEGTESTPAVYVLLKFVATWLTSWSGVPAGIFAPSLAIGAALGNDVALLTHYPNAPTLIALGMAGFLAAATQAPLTAFIIVMEMVDGHAMVLSLMACALAGSVVSRILSHPLYGSLAKLQLLRMGQRRAVSAEPASPKEPTPT
jgi:H+/Cl- antiporter ClcA